MKREDIERIAELETERYSKGAAIYAECERDIYKDGFMAGADWRINNIWHTCKKEPDKGRLLLVEDIDSAYELVYLTQSKPWKELTEKNHYMKWAYVEDLLPTEEGNQ